MDRNIIYNIASNYCHMYMLNESKYLDDLKQLVAKHYPRQYQIYTYICNNAPNTNVEMYDGIFYVITDAEQNKNLLDDLSTNLATELS